MRCVLSNSDTDQCPTPNHSEYDCRHCDRGLDIFVEKMGLKLFSWQREFLKKVIKQGRPIYVIPGRYRGNTYFGGLELMRDVLLKGE